MDTSSRLPFSLPAFLLAPWPVPLTYSVFLTLSMPSRSPFWLFVISLGAGLAVGYLGTAVLLACLWLAARVHPVTKTLAALMGTVLAGAGYLPVLYQDYLASGDNSGPPSGSFRDYFLNNWNSPILYGLLAAGFVTALLYVTFAGRFGRAAASTG